MKVWNRVRSTLTDEPRATCESCGTASACDTSCRAEAARDRARWLAVRAGALGG